jgi:hypothetical protein
VQEKHVWRIFAILAPQIRPPQGKASWPLSPLVFLPSTSAGPLIYLLELFHCGCQFGQIDSPPILTVESKYFKICDEQESFLSRALASTQQRSWALSGVLFFEGKKKLPNFLILFPTGRLLLNLLPAENLISSC